MSKNWMAIIVIALIALALGAKLTVFESHHQSPRESPTPIGGVEGHVLLRPTCPVERIPPDPRCADKGYQTTVNAYKAGSTRVYASTHSDASGAFSLPLTPGTYMIGANGGETLPRCVAVSVTVLGSYVTQNISCDTGIR